MIYTAEDQERFIKLLNDNCIELLSLSVPNHTLPRDIIESMDLKEKKDILKAAIDTTGILKQIGQEQSPENKEIILSMITKNKFLFFKNLKEIHCIVLIKDAIKSGMSLTEIHENFEKISSNLETAGITE